MQRFKIHSQPFMTLALAVLSGFLSSAATAEQIFYDSFEVANSSGDPVGWQTAGHPSYLGVIGESSAWSTPYGQYGMTTYSTGVGTRTIGFLPEGSGNYTVKFNIASTAAIGEYRAELWVIDWANGPILLGHATGDTNGTKNMSFSGQITWRYNYVFGTSLDGAELQIKLMQDPLRSNWQHTPIWDNVSVDWVPDVDSSGPTVVDIVDDKQGASVLATNSLVTYTVTFNEPMNATTVGITDFDNAGSSDVTIESVTPTTNNAVFLVGVRPTNEGNLRLKINETADLRDTTGNAMELFALIQDNVTFIVEAGTPILLPADIVDDKGGASVTVNTPVIYTLTFSKDMNASTVSAADFGNTDSPGAAPINIGTPTETTPTSGVFTVQVTPTGSGTLQFRVKNGVAIQAADGGILNTESQIADDTILVVDSVKPTLTAIIDYTDGNPVAVGAPLIYDVIFSEDMNAATVSASDFSNALTTGNAPFTIDSLEEASPGVFRIEITPTGAGSIQLQINAGATLEDPLGNTLNTTVAILDDTTITVQSTAADPFEDWAGVAIFGDDENGDGVTNGLAWALGAANPNDDANELLPTIDAMSDPDFVIFTFSRKDDANEDPNTIINVQHGTTLMTNDWSIAIHDGTDVIITEEDNFYSADPGIDRVTVKLRKSVFAQNGSLFVRLGVSRAL